MQGIKGSRGYDRFEGIANAYSQNYGKRSENKRAIVLSRPDGHKKCFDVSRRLAERLKLEASYCSQEQEDGIEGD